MINTSTVPERSGGWLVVVNCGLIVLLFQSDDSLESLDPLSCMLF